MTLAKFGEVDEAMKILHGHSSALQKDLQAGTGEKFFPLVDDYRGLPSGKHTKTMENHHV